MPDRYSCVAFEYIVAVREYEFYLPVLDKCLRAELISVDEFLDDEVI